MGIKKSVKNSKKIRAKYTKLLEASYKHPIIGNEKLFSVIESLIILLVIEGFNRETPFGGFMFLAQNPFAFLLNFLIIFACMSVSWLFKRRWFASSLVMLIWITLGVINGVVLSTRMTPFTTADFAIMDLGIEMFSVYLTPVQTAMIIAAICLGAVSFTFTFISDPKRRPWGGKKGFLKSLTATVLAFLVLFGAWNIGTATGFVASYFTNLWDAYTDYGMPYGFLSTWLRKGISKPYGYSKDSVDAVFDKGELKTMTSDTEPEKSAKDFPNIVFLQLESFIDPTEVKDLKFSSDPAPFFRELKENYSSGYLRVPVVGGGTANTEFEAITGMSCREFGPGEYPYKSVLKDKALESMAFDLAELDYATHAIHNHRGAFYDRNKVFPRLGFDDFTSLEYMNYVGKTQRAFAKDDILTGEILGALETTPERDYIYTISVQGHGEYPRSALIKNPRITLEGAESAKQKNSWEYYLQQVVEMDEFLQVLTAELEKFDEPVALVVYGDHLPALHLSNDMMKSGDIFNTEYVVWSNFGLEKQDKDLSTYQLGAEIQRRLGLRQGVMSVFHQDKAETPDYGKNLHLLQYDILYGRNYIYGGKSPYRPTDMRMGYRPIKVEKIVEVAGDYYISGGGFTPFSKVTLDGDVLKTTYVGPNVLKLEEQVDPDRAGDMKVSQVEKYNAILSTTE